MTDDEFITEVRRRLDDDSIRRTLLSVLAEDRGYPLDQRCGCGKHPDDTPVRFHQRGTQECRASLPAP